MRKLLILILLVAELIVPTALVQAEPEYAKWGKIAVEATQKRYEADIIDYKHIGRVELSEKTSEEKFKLWLRSKEGKEFGVYVIIQFDPSNDVIYSIIFDEKDGTTLGDRQI